MSEFILGQHENAIRTLLERTERISDDVNEIKTLLAERRGERRVALWVAGVVGAVASTLFGAALKLVTGVLRLGG